MSVSLCPSTLVVYTQELDFSSFVSSCLIRYQMERLSHLKAWCHIAVLTWKKWNSDIPKLCACVSEQNLILIGNFGVHSWFCSWPNKNNQKKKKKNPCLNHILFNTATKYPTSQGCSFLCPRVLLCLVQVDLSSPCACPRWILTPPVSLKLDCFFFLFFSIGLDKNDQDVELVLICCCTMWETPD